MNSRHLFISAAALFITTATSHSAITLFDAITDVTGGFGVGGAPGNTFMGQALTLDGPSFSAASNSILSFEIGLANTTGAAINAPVRLNLWIWQGYDPAAAAPTGVFSSQVGTPGTPTVVSDFGVITLDNNRFATATTTLNTPISVNPLNGTTIGITINWQIDQGAGFVNLPGFTTLVRGGTGQPGPVIGENLVGAAPNFGYYRNAGGETNGNFLSSSARNVGANSSLYLTINGPDPIPEPATAMLASVFCLTLLRRRRSGV